ncbi:hypothetical protein [Streptomyces sp. WAC01280]|uniref:hypothetical protein n=1 Tax=Streptomyces sp. WAC01280 TaxID=2487424 RepID=UPI000F76F756|nr:hypothetical protein [Streptomyces sp. WAC01280]RSS50952.1 hypothetical protein EF909_36620 [Streptomyces sp. WAC01280]
MSPDLRTRAASPVPITPPDVEGERLRKRSLIWVGLLLPAALVAGFLTLLTEAASTCIAKGTGCGGAPGYLYVASLVVAGAAFVTVQSTSRADVRRAALWTQLGAEAVFLLFVLTTFA